MCLIICYQSHALFRSATIQNATAARCALCPRSCINLHKMHNPISPKYDSTALSNATYARFLPHEKYCVHMHNARPTDANIPPNYRDHLCSPAACSRASKPNRLEPKAPTSHPNTIATHFHHFSASRREVQWQQAQHQSPQQLVMPATRKNPPQKTRKGKRCPCTP